MNEEKKSEMLFSILMFIALLSIVSYVIHDIVTNDYWDIEYIIVEGEVTEVIPVKDNDGSIDYYHVYFDTGEQYRIKLRSKEIDFTVNSKLICELFYYPNQDDDFKYLNQIVKVPDG